ncbi:DEAD/DEAH box helicase [Corynebacterium amycolatum]|uniref:DEAD/DEAH box helicase n=1 Tax=Corynebacterium amycolatum TaxID=43765 RepID=UPI001E470017|nr:DEAD/DEAH box helicase [Corynebacterium amycolatum]
MSSLLPAYAAEHVLDGLSEYLTTSFSLAERNTAENLERFLKDPVNGMFHGPYIRTRLPYAPATQWEGLLEWLPEWFAPYRHQAEAFKRLSSLSDGIERRPEPTLVVTGTGSGKTESFLYPILDHCRRERLRGRSGGVKALILYPMNALANDQAARLASLISTEPELAGIRAGIYTGENQGDRMSVSEAGLITDRETMRQSPPDILLTNYKMLDQLLLRDADAGIWQKSATTLQYVALDEFHTYDGAQGTDVALLLRRMGLRLKKHQPEGFLNEVEGARPLGKITPVATSATLGSGEKATEEILHFAHTIFGEKLSPDAIVRETTLDIPSWQNTIADFTGVASTPTSMPSRDVVVAINDEIANQSAEGTAEHDAIVHRVFCERVFGCNDDVDVAVAAASTSELVVKILENTSTPIQLGSADSSDETLVEAVLDAEVQRLPDGGAAEFLSHALTEIAYLRAKFGELHGWTGKKFPGVETHLWVREVSRVDRRVGLRATDSLKGLTPGK